MKLIPSSKINDSPIKSLIKDTLYNSFAQAIFKILETQFFSLKGFIFFFITTSSGLCSYLILQLVMNYFSYDVSTTSRTFYEIPSKFPKVTICNTYPFTTHYAAEFLKQVNKEISEKINDQIDIFSQDLSRINFNYKHTFLNQIYSHAIFKMNSLNETGKRKLSHPLEDIMSLCLFNTQNCSVDDFVWYFDPIYGNCWIFNATNKVNSFPGEFYGLRVVLYVNFYETLKEINSYAFFGGGGLGALLRIDNCSYLTSYLPEDGIRIESGHKTSVSLSRSFKTNLPRPYSDCLIDNKTNSGFRSELFDLIQNSPYRYTQPACFLQCFQRVLLSECNCTYPNLISLTKNASKCFRLTDSICTENFLRTKFLKTNFFDENCLNECPLECYLDNIDTLLSSVEFVPNVYLDY